MGIVFVNPPIKKSLAKSLFLIELCSLEKVGLNEFLGDEGTIDIRGLYEIVVEKNMDEDGGTSFIVATV